MNLTTFIFVLILIFPIYFFTKKILESSKIGSKGSQVGISIFVCIFLCPFLYGGVVGGKLMIEDYFLQHEFSQETWMTEKGYSNLDDFRGEISYEKFDEPQAFERIQFMKYFGGFE